MNYEKILHLIFTNEVVMNSLKELFLEEAGKSLPRVAGQADETLGQEYRAHCKAKEIIEDTFMRLSSMNGAEQGSGSIKYK